MFRTCGLTAGLIAAASIVGIGQVQTNVPPVEPNAKPAVVEHIKIHGTALEGNLEGDAVDRDVIVFLPPSYARERTRRYPVVYALHGYSIGAEQWTHEIHVPQTIEGAFAKGSREMIVVLPDSKTVHNGSMYSSSPTTGDFESYIAHDVVSYIDAHYRTIPARESRGLVGHSMGGYGASRIGMKHADVFGSLYIMSPCCMSARGGGTGPSRRRPTRRSCRSVFARSSRPPRRGRPIPRTRRSIWICPSATISRPCSPSGRPTRRWPSSISTSQPSGGIARSPSTSAIRTGCASMPASCTTS
jgi:pimeloyl-ACP methyl ester carboxylesterase